VWCCGGCGDAGVVYARGVVVNVVVVDSVRVVICIVVDDCCVDDVVVVGCVFLCRLYWGV